MLTTPVILLIFFIILVVVSAVLTHTMCSRVRILDIANERSSHTGVKPKSGGVAIVSCFYLMVLVLLIYQKKYEVMTAYWLIFFVSALILAILSFLDDIKDISAKLRLIVHIMIAILMLKNGWVVTNLSLPGEQIALSAGAYVLSFLWILGLTNACNFVDGIDGLVASMVIIACGFFTAINYAAGNEIATLLSLSIMAGCFGFILFNWSPAKIFMGDVGSAFLGFVLAALAIYCSQNAPNKIDFWIMPLLLGHLIFDAVLTFVRRLLRGENVLQAHRDHLYQLLVRSGYSHARVSAIAIFMTVLNGFGAIYLLNLAPQYRLYVLLTFILLQSAYAIWVLRRARNIV